VVTCLINGLSTELFTRKGSRARAAVCCETNAPDAGPVLSLFVVGLPAWLFVLYSVERAMNLLTSPGVWVACAVVWMILSLSYVLGSSN